MEFLLLKIETGTNHVFHVSQIFHKNYKMEYCILNFNFIMFNKINTFGDTPSETAVFHNSVNATKILLKKKAQSEIKTRSSESTMLHIAAEFNRTGLVDPLLQHNAQLNIRDKQQKLTPVHNSSKF